MNLNYFKDSQNWEALPVVTSLDWAEILPKKNLEGGERTLGRYETQEIPREVWDTIIDPDRIDSYAKYNFVDRYFATCVFSLRRMRSISVAANQSYETVETVTHASTLRNSITESLRIETVLGGSAGAKGKGSAEASVKTAYEISKTNEYTDEKSKVTTITLHYDPVAYDRDAVLWDLVKTVAIYRVFEGETVLIGLGDFYVGSSQATYRCGDGLAV